MCEDAVKEFSNVCMRAVVHDEFLSDVERKRHLAVQGYKIGKGSGLGCNCLIDSLLQLLLSQLMYLSIHQIFLMLKLLLCLSHTLTS